jgi:hypothetical protein
VTTSPTGFFVQFPHPGGEHNPPTDDMAWNTGPHRRKFLIAPGRYLDSDDQIGAADLVFWGEWEPPSQVERRWPASRRLPRALHRPSWGEPTRRVRQNTDPWVWGEPMIYSNCKQIGPRPHRRPSSMQRLTRGSVICFGSTIQGEFCLDTVFVVASAEPWTPGEATDLTVDEAFKTCTAGAIAARRSDAHLPLTLYRGATADNPVQGMFNFVPARRADRDDLRFPRPPIQLPGFINPASRQSTWGSKRPLPLNTLRNNWEAVRHQVLTADLLLAVWLRTPNCQSNPAAVARAARQRC